MKRSELLVSLEEMLIRSENFQRGGAVELANEVLDFIENAGMTPPRYMALMRNGEKYDKDKHFGADVIDRVSWEPEDE